MFSLITKSRRLDVPNIFSKLFERLMYNKLIKFLDKFNTHHALITLVDTITKSLDNGDIVIGVFIDLKRHSIQ